MNQGASDRAVSHLRYAARPRHESRLKHPRGESEMSADVDGAPETVRVADRGQKVQGAKWTHSGNLHEAPAQVILARISLELEVALFLAAPLLFAMVEKSRHSSVSSFSFRPSIRKSSTLQTLLASTRTSRPAHNAFAMSQPFRMGGPAQQDDTELMAQPF